YYVDDGQKAAVEASRASYDHALKAAGHGSSTTEIAQLGEFYYAEDYHQQYLSDAKNPNGYCGIGGTGVACPVGVSSSTPNPGSERF
ncbi:MAG TPA: peptide-methionine (S)-S-oxide reductase, partial [Pseudonocardiaceae bacterium]